MWAAALMQVCGSAFHAIAPPPSPHTRANHATLAPYNRVCQELYKRYYGFIRKQFHLR